MTSCSEKSIESNDCSDFNSVFSLIDTDGDGLTDCEETTAIDNPNTISKPITITDPHNPFNGVLDTVINVGGALNESLVSIAKTNDGGFVCVGFTQSNNGDIDDFKGGNDFWLLKYDNKISLEWSMNYGGTKEEIASRVIQVNDGGFVMVGYSKSNDIDLEVNHGQKDIWVVKINAIGDIIWTKTYGFEGDEEGLSVIETKEGGLLVCGYIDVTASGGKGNDLMMRQHGVGDIWALKLDENGNLEWRRYFGGSNNDRAYDVVQSADDGFLIAGTSESEDFDISKPNGSYDYWLVKLSKAGKLLWEKSYGGSEIDDCYRILPVENNNFLLIGNTFSLTGSGIVNKGYSDIWILKIDAQGQIVWQKTYGGSAFDSAVSGCMTKKGDYVISGNSRSRDKDLDENKGQNDIWVFKIDTNGEIIWNKIIGGKGFDIANDVVELNDYSLIVVGESNSKDQDISNNKGYSDGVIIKIK